MHDRVDAARHEDWAIQVSGGLGLERLLTGKRTGDEEGEVTLDWPADAPLEPVVSDVPPQAPDVIGLIREGACVALAAGARHEGQHPRLRVAELGADCASRDRRLFHGVRADLEGRKATLRVAHQHLDLLVAEVFAGHVGQNHRVERLQLR